MVNFNYIYQSIKRLMEFKQGAKGAATGFGMADGQAVNLAFSEKTHGV